MEVLIQSYPYLSVHSKITALSPVRYSSGNVCETCHFFMATRLQISTLYIDFRHLLLPVRSLLRDMIADDCKRQSSSRPWRSRGSTNTEVLTETREIKISTYGVDE